MKFNREEFERGTRELERWLAEEARRETGQPNDPGALGCALIVVLVLLLVFFATSV